jgi:putative transposon-encoded protein
VKLTASGRDKRGAGNASADIFASMVEADGGTTVSIATDLKVAGKVAQFGRSAMADISKKLLGQFAECIEAKLQQADVVDETETEPETLEAPNDEAEASAPEPEVSIDDDDDVLDLMGVAGVALAKRLIPAVGGVVAAVIVYLIVRN